MTWNEGHSRAKLYLTRYGPFRGHLKRIGIGDGDEHRFSAGGCLKKSWIGHGPAYLRLEFLGREKFFLVDYSTGEKYWPRILGGDSSYSGKKFESKDLLKKVCKQTNKIHLSVYDESFYTAKITLELYSNSLFCVITAFFLTNFRCLLQDFRQKFAENLAAILPKNSNLRARSQYFSPALYYRC